MLHYPADHFDTHSPAFGDCGSADELVRRHGQLVRRIAWHVRARMSASSELEDLIQTGLIALIEAARSYEDRGHAFTTYASMRIRGAMIDQLRRDARVSRSVMDAQKRIAMARARLEQRQMQLPSDADVAAELGMAPSAFAAYSAAAASVEQSSLDDSYSDHDMGFADPAPLADMLVERAQAQAGLAEAIATLPEREARILQLYFVEELNLHEIGDVLGIGAARVCQIKKAALARLRIRLAQ